jgi:hypothetical protein
VSFLFGKPVQRENVPTGICENFVAFFYRTASMVSMNLFGVLMDIEAIVTTVVAVGLLGCFVYTLLGKLLVKLLRKVGL